MELHSDLAWKKEWAGALRTAQDLFRAGYIRESEIPGLEPVLKKYRFVLPQYYAELIDRENPRCPIRLQSIPDLKELETELGYFSDPLKDLEHQPAPKITHRYFGRVLLHLTPNCSMYCRFCFRKTLLNDQRDDLFQGELSEALEYIKTQGSVSEVILSGGDPFLANEELLSSVLDTLDSLSHIKRVRFHTRVPVTLPIRVTESFAELLKRKGFQTIIVSHFNHPKEITPSSLKAIGVLKNADFLLLNQSVLLKGVNDCSETLEQLQLSLFEAGVLPYYLHHPDRAEGTSHFDLSFEEGKKLFNELQTRLPGYLCPRYVIDKIDEPFKSIIE